ncbi:phage coat protein [Anaerococcus sp. AGMB00486]|uniref:Phage coat protein n=2 Tax=Anaerococcus TaxID=165779 RepID=A0ABX2N817_9FIRM|nr:MULTISPECIES: phage coat protein [Anaerococcus]MSS77384.1 phage coat protein [Anaerococcus porci]NVF10815.1 phage coat protein [Anaerococcus faecalis]
MPKLFDKTYFNAEVFEKYVDTIERERTNELLNSSAIVERADLKTRMDEQVGGNIIVTPIAGILSGDADNYDGQTDIKSDSTNTFYQKRVVIGRAHSWTEKDFVFDITGGHDPMRTVANQLLDWWADLKQDSLLAIIEGIFSMTGGENKKFVDTHTYKEDVFGQVTLNNALQQAFGSRKKSFAAAIMNSAVSTQLENLNLIQYAKYTDSRGIERPLQLANLNGRPIIIDDSLPVSKEGEYTTYIFGQGAFEYTKAGAKVPYETDRNPMKNGGEDTLYTRDRFCFAPRGISFTESSMVSLSPTDEELKKGANWEVVKNEDGAFPLKQIPIARVITKLGADKAVSTTPSGTI